MKFKISTIAKILFFKLILINLLIAGPHSAITDSLVDAPEFSVKHGFYKNSFDLILNTKTSNSIIKYTLDGSDPRISKNVVIKDAPVTVRIDPESTEGQRPRAPGVVIRACTMNPDNSESEVSTNTYLFIDKVGALSPEGQKPGTGWPNPSGSANPQAYDYGMDPSILNDSRYKNLISEALLSVPTISVVTDLPNLFSPDSGIYMNAMQDGAEWERPASIELMNPDSSEGFQINAGLRIRGGWSRHGENPKHAFRLFFRDEYGKGKLDYKLFEDEGIDEFDKLDLRTSQNYSWSYPGHQGQYNTMNRDVFSRDMQREMGQPYTRSRYYHLYINGVYWGLFQSQERPEARFAASYFGGNIEDYDVIKNGDSGIDATDGNLEAYRQLWNYCQTGFTSNTTYFRIQGLNSDGTINSSYKNLVDIDNLIDYMLVIFYAGNFDSPTSKFGSNKGVNNFYCIYNRNGNEGFKFFAHDAEHALRTTAGEGPGIGLYENRVNIGNLTDGYKMVVTSFSNFHPQWLHFKLSDNAEYRIRFADHVYKHFFNYGCMTPAKAVALFLSRAKEIEMAIIGESARWGNKYANPARTKDNDWLPSINDIVNNYFPYRTNIVLNQLKDVNLYPSIDPPVFQNNAVEIQKDKIGVNSGYIVNLVNPNNAKGTIQYTIDGKDPREIGGSVSASASNGGNETNITINSTTIIKARILDGTTWSALHEITLFVDNNINNLKITEINYHPLDGVNVSDNEYEFIELKNIGTTQINLTQAHFADGIIFTFPQGTLINPGEFIVLASNNQEFFNRYNFYPFGEYAGQLDNSGERITLCSALGDTIFSVKYNDKSPWPDSADGTGYTMVTKGPNPQNDLNDPLNWRASYEINGSPGKDDPASTSVETSKSFYPEKFELYQNYPNPFNPSTKISFVIPNSSFVIIKVYNILGKEVTTLVNEKKSAGTYEVTWDAKNLASGIYFYKIQSGDFVQVKKMVLLK